MAIHASSRPSPALQSTLQWWSLRSGRERVVIVLVSGIVAIALLWSFVWQPLQRDSERMARELVDQRAALAEARHQADEIAGLARSAPTPPPSDARAAIDGTLASKGLKSAAGSVERLDGERWRITFDAIAFDALTALLDALQRDAGVRAAEVSVTARVEPGQVRAEVTLARG